jgi:hypothetical protein
MIQFLSDVRMRQQREQFFPRRMPVPALFLFSGMPREKSDRPPRRIGNP